jgi:hypothetical protein
MEYYKHYKYNDLSNLPDALRQRILAYRRARDAGLKELVHRQNLLFLDSIESEMWNLFGLPGETRPGLIVALVATALSQEVRKQARINVLEANRIAISDYEHYSEVQEQDIRQIYALSQRAKEHATSEQA